MTRAGVQSCSEGSHLRGWVLPEMQRRAAGETIGMWTKMAKQKGLNAGNPLLACLRRCEHVVTHCNFASAEQVSKMEFGVCELPERGSDYAAGGADLRQTMTRPSGPVGRSVTACD